MGYEDTNVVGHVLMLIAIPLCMILIFKESAAAHPLRRFGLGILAAVIVVAGNWVYGLLEEPVGNAWDGIVWVGENVGWWFCGIPLVILFLVILGPVLRGIRALVGRLTRS